MTIRLIEAAACAAAVAFVAGCAAPVVIADIEHDKVVVQANRYTSVDAVRAEAAKGCALHGRTAVPISRRLVGAYNERALYLFACRKPARTTDDPK